MYSQAASDHGGGAEPAYSESGTERGLVNIAQRNENRDRRDRAHEAVRTYWRLTRFDISDFDLALQTAAPNGGSAVNEVGQEGVVDLVCDLLHLGEQFGLEPQAVWDRANVHYLAEVDD